MVFCQWISGGLNSLANQIRENKKPKKGHWWLWPTSNLHVWNQLPKVQNQTFSRKLELVQIWTSFGSYLSTTSLVSHFRALHYPCILSTITFLTSKSSKLYKADIMHLGITCTHQYRNKDKVEQHKQGQSYSPNSNSFPALISHIRFHISPSQGNETSSQ